MNPNNRKLHQANKIREMTPQNQKMIGAMALGMSVAFMALNYGFSSWKEPENRDPEYASKSSKEMGAEKIAKKF